MGPVLENSETIYRELVETIKCGVYITDKRGCLLYVNQGFVEIFGYSDKAEVLGLNLADDLYVRKKEKKCKSDREIWQELVKLNIFMPSHYAYAKWIIRDLTFFPDFF